MPRTAPLSEEDRQQAVTALTVLIDEWWSAGVGVAVQVLMIGRANVMALRRVAW